MIQQVGDVFTGSYQTYSMDGLQSVYSGHIDKQWHHMALTKDNNELKFYIDGVLVGTSPTPAVTGPFQNLNKYILGHAYDIMWKGSLDDLRFYKRVLTAAEINTLSKS
jgi:hypothetical protein